MSPHHPDALHAELLRLERRLAELEREREAATRWRRRGAASLAVCLAGVAGVALAAGPCANGIPHCFNADEPAQAVEVNANFAALKTWLEAKVGPTGAVGSPNRDVTTARVVATSYAPGYFNWNSFTPGAGGAGLVNDDASYKALMVVGNTSADGARRRVRVYDELWVNGSVTSSAWQVACAGGESGYHFGFCCRMNTRDGSAECRNGTGTTFAAWSSAATLFPAGAEGTWSLSCAGHRAGANWPICCRTNQAGSTECKVSNNAGPLTWSNAANPW
jgi:hypothetical protein